MSASQYRTLFLADLVQDSALSVGGSDPDDMVVDAHFSRDGAGRLGMPGEGIAGALVATTRKIAGRVPEDISGAAGGGPRPSRWDVHTSHPAQEPPTEFRTCVGIRQDTGARAGGVLHDVEVTPRGTRWPFILNVDAHGPGGEEAETLAAAALLEWQRGRCWLGRDVARGLGWMRLENLRALRLDVSQAALWPDSRREPKDVIAGLPGGWIAAGDFEDTFGAVAAESGWHYVEVSGLVQAGDREDGYGLEALAVGGQEVPATTAEALPGLLTPESMERDEFLEAFAPDSMVALTCPAGGTLEPFLPGSGLRGPQRHALSRRERAAGAPVRDPNVEKEDAQAAPDALEALFGRLSASAALLVCDAHPVAGDAASLALLEHHAEDEFSGGVFGSSKFNRAVLATGTFRWRMVLETRDLAVVDAFRQKTLPYLRALGASRALPIGGARWRSAGWPLWTVEEVKAGRAGRDAEAAGEGVA